MNTHIENYTAKIAYEHAAQGDLIEFGWQRFAHDHLQDASLMQHLEMRKAFYLGAQYMLFSTVLLAVHDPDLAHTTLLDKVEAELDTFFETLARAKK